MARLKAHGTELLRVERESDIANDELITWERITKAVMSDGKVLQKRDVRFKPDQYRPNGELYSYGWKVYAKVKPGKTAQDIVNAYTRAISEKPETKWRIISGGPAPVIISQKRILAALESGNHVGFCKNCGAEHDGIEPDARNYRCDDCGFNEVYGAEEMAMC